MRNPINNRPAIIFTALLPLAIGIAIFLNTDNTTPTRDAVSNYDQWTVQIDDVTFASDSLGMLTEQLYEEAHGERNAEELVSIIRKINRELENVNNPSTHLLTDLLRDLSLEHSDNQVRRYAYHVMMTALESEREPFDAGDIAAH